RVIAAADALPVTVRARLNGPAATPFIEAEGAWGDLRFAASGKADLARAGFDGSVTAFHPNAVRLLGDLGFSGNEWIGPGSFSYCGSLHWAG
ncbi:hypothetical protein V3474_29350, partial [Pseudomonas aeruginosa]|uniref:hypothetical protein n=1 Tax=Pseudomonas aeruginosa TaxID=287 RepID=UPI002F94DB05